MATKPTIFFWNQTPGRSPLTLTPHPSWALLPGLGIKFGYTALIAASERGKVEVVEALLAAGADREAKDNVRAPPCPPRPSPRPPMTPPIGSDPIGHGLRYGEGGRKGTVSGGRGSRRAGGPCDGSLGSPKG